MTPPARKLVGRAGEIGSFERILNELDNGHCSAVALVGEPGIGKTRLLTELAARGELRGQLVLAGSSSELERDQPFSVFVDALDEFVEGLDPEELATLDDDVQAQLSNVFPSLAPLGRGREVALQQERYRTHRAVRALLEYLARKKPLVLTLDDLQWADFASVELLAALLRRPPGAAVLTAMALRPHRVPERLSSALERAHRAGSLTRIELGALTHLEARELLGETVDDGEATILFEESGGNPFYLEQLARSRGGSGRVAPVPPTSMNEVGVPSAVVRSLNDELGLLSRRARLVLSGAAVAGDPFEPELAAVAAGTSEAAVMDALDDLLQVDLVRTTDVPRRFRFRHPLVRRAVYEATLGGWRLGAHERCAGALAVRGATAARAHHVERSARMGDLAAVAVLRQAGEEAARVAPASAARWFGSALRLLPEAAPSQERVALIFARAGALAATGQFTESHRDLLECLEFATRDATDWRVRVTTACAAVEHLLGLQKEAHEHLSTALTELTDPGSAEAVQLMIELTLDGFHSGNFESMRGWAERAVAGATSLGARALLAAALAVRAWADSLIGDDHAQVHCDEATDLVDDLANEELARHLSALAHLASADLYLDRFAAAARHAQRALDIGRATGQGELFPSIGAMLGGALWVQGRPREAGELFDGLVEGARLAGNVQSLAWNLFNQSIAALAAGDVDVALSAAEESVELLSNMEPGPLSALAAAVLASALFESGHADRSVDLLITRAGGEELRLIGGGWRARFLELLTRGLLATGKRSDAERAAAAAQTCADAVALPSAAAMASLAAAAVALETGDPEAASEHALAGAAALDSIAARWDAARARCLAGRALAEAGHRDRAAVELERAAAAFESFGSLRYRDQAERELRKLGRHITRRTRPGTTDGLGYGSLTERELQVARLIVDRKTNAQIAAELFLGEKTVETHVHNIFNKMGVAKRVDLARAVERADHGSVQPRSHRAGALL